jgi:hypothetical protein
LRWWGWEESTYLCCRVWTYMCTCMYMPTCKTHSALIRGSLTWLWGVSICSLVYVWVHIHLVLFESSTPFTPLDIGDFNKGEMASTGGTRGRGE